MIIVEETEGSVVVLTPTYEEGEDPKLSNISPVREAVARLVADGRRKIVLDLREVDFLLSVDIAALVGSARAIHGQQGLFLLCGLGLRLAETLAVVQLLRVLPVRFTRNEAVHTLKQTRADKDGVTLLVDGNPTMDRIRQWWDHIVQAQTSEIRINPVLIHQAEDPDPDPDSGSGPRRIRPGVIDPHTWLETGHNGIQPHESAMHHLRPDLNDWVSGLETLKTAQRLFANHGLRFTPEITFKEFLSQLAEKLIEKE
ncbi:MAG: STAS domain-containing protein [Candidatus Sumerlaeia bacterium]|nr:STAS domain-containing protein [Candidatus Sumerlaeia bacterium]